MTREAAWGRATPRLRHRSGASPGQTPPHGPRPPCQAESFNRAGEGGQAVRCVVDEDAQRFVEKRRALAEFAIVDARMMARRTAVAVESIENSSSVICAHRHA